MDESALRILLDSLEKSRSSLDSWLFWATLLVAVGVALEVVFVVWEYIEDLNDFRRGTIRSPEKPRVILLVLGLLGASLVAVGVAGELYIDARIGSFDTKIRKANDDRALLLSKEAGDAKVSADASAAAAQRAREESDKAVASASNSLALASGARKEADSFERDIKSAKEQAAEAESHLADALKQAADATAELSRMKSPRSLTRVPELVAALEPFKGTEYVFKSVFQDEESILLLKAINEVLQQAGWKRGKSLGGFPGIMPYGQDMPDFAVPVGFNIGIQVSTESTLANPQSMQLKDLPPYLQAAIALNIELPVALSPPQDSAVGRLVNLEKGTSMTVLIAVGRKP